MRPLIITGDNDIFCQREICVFLWMWCFAGTNESRHRDLGIEIRINSLKAIQKGVSI